MIGETVSGNSLRPMTYQLNGSRQFSQGPAALQEVGQVNDQTAR
jgi:hypothetical protein